MLLKRLKIIELCLCFFFIFTLAKTAHPSPCRIILQDPRLRDQQILENSIFSDGDAFVFNKIIPGFSNPIKSVFKRHEAITITDNGKHERIFLENKQEILTILKNQGTLVAPMFIESSRKNIYVVQGGQSRLGRIAQKVWSLYGIKILIDFKNLEGAEGVYDSFKKSIYLGLKDLLYPNQLSKTLWHEVLHAKNDFESLVHIFIDDQTEQNNPYSSFCLDEILTYEKELNHIQNSRLFSQRVGGDMENVPGGIISSKKILKSLSQRVLAKKSEILELFSLLKSLEKNPRIEFQQSWKNLEFKDRYPQIKVLISDFLKESLKTAPSGYLELFPEYEDYYFKGTPEEYRADFIRRTHYSINLISKALEIAEKRAVEPLQIEN